MEDDLRAGRLVDIAGIGAPAGAPVHAPVRVIYPQRLHLSRRVRLFIDLLTERLAPSSDRPVAAEASEEA